MAFQLPKLPYGLNALAPMISEETMKYHYGKHHQTYLNNLNQLIVGKPYEHMMLEDIVMMSAGFDQPVFNNAAQAWNHTFFWMCMSPNGGGMPGGRLMSDIMAKWGTYEAFRDAFIAKAAGNFGSGWTWLVLNPETGLEIINTSNADTPLASQRLCYYGPDEERVGNIAGELMGKLLGGKGNVFLIGTESNDFYRLALRKKGFFD